MRPPCEIVTKHVLPALRAMLVRDLVKRHKLTQAEVAKKLGITQPAVSQYLNELRGSGYIRTIRKWGVKKPLRELSDAIASGKVEGEQILRMYCHICTRIKKEKISHGRA